MFLTPDLLIGYKRIDATEMVSPFLLLVIEAAELNAVAYLNRSVFPDKDAMDAAIADGTAGSNPMLIQADIKAGMLFIAGHLYDNREDVLIGTVGAELPMGSRHFLRPHRISPGV